MLPVLAIKTGFHESQNVIPMKLKDLGKHLPDQSRSRDFVHKGPKRAAPIPCNIKILNLVANATEDGI
jgi:hypothetical protein